MRSFRKATRKQDRKRAGDAPGGRECSRAGEERQGCPPEQGSVSGLQKMATHSNDANANTTAHFPLAGHEKQREEPVKISRFLARATEQVLVAPTASEKHQGSLRRGFQSGWAESGSTWNSRWWRPWETGQEPRQTGGHLRRTGLHMCHDSRAEWQRARHSSCTRGCFRRAFFRLREKGQKRWRTENTGDW